MKILSLAVATFALLSFSGVCYANHHKGKAEKGSKEKKSEKGAEGATDTEKPKTE